MCPVLLQKGTTVPGGKHAGLGKVKPDISLLTCNQGNFNRTIARSRIEF